MIRVIIIALAIVPATIWYGFKVLWHAYRGTPSSASVYDECPRAWSRLIMALSGVRVVYENVEAIDATRPQIVVANHTSWYDVLALTAFIPGRTVFVAKKELLDVPIFGRAAVACGHIFIDRKDRSAAIDSLQTAKKRLEDDRPTVITFPDGSRSRDGKLQTLKTGAFVLAIQAGVDIVPAAISGSREIMRKGSWKVNPGVVKVRFGAPIEASGLVAEDRNRLTDRARDELAALLAVDDPSALPQAEGADGVREEQPDND